MMTLDNLLWLVVAVGAGSFLFRIARFDGFRGALFGASIGSTLGEVELGGAGFGRKQVKIHRLASRGPDEPMVGLEIAQSTIGSLSIVPVAMSREQALTLAGLLTRAAEA